MLPIPGPYRRHLTLRGKFALHIAQLRKPYWHRDMLTFKAGSAGPFGFMDVSPMAPP